MRNLQALIQLSDHSINDLINTIIDTTVQRDELLGYVEDLKSENDYLSQQVEMLGGRPHDRGTH